MNIKFALKRFLRVAAGQAVGIGAEVAIGYATGLKLPAPIAPLIPLFVGPAINAGAKALRDNLDPEHPVQVVASLF